MKYSDCVAYAESEGTRLPTIAEVRQELDRNGGKPLFGQEDMWWPVSDAKDTWVSVGNYESDDRLGRTHDEICGVPPPWSEEDRNVAERSVIAIVRLKKENEGGDNDENEGEDGEENDGEENEEEDGEENEANDGEEEGEEHEGEDGEENEGEDGEGDGEENEED
jgi:hypothetical protein